MNFYFILQVKILDKSWHLGQILEKYLEELFNLVRMNSLLRNFQRFSLDFKETVTAVTVTFLDSTSLCLYLNRS